ncbi:Hypothetical predicted protein [Octopus vulgaris]|uniref:Secreted protein n=1 Tax=Octopus vulgaris TaxID=6645 RepID=A0AA36BA54_OCTVU|nr:Hypothetical predicted protein [Octopus vulgaris]
MNWMTVSTVLLWTGLFAIDAVPFDFGVDVGEGVSSVIAVAVLNYDLICENLSVAQYGYIHLYCSTRLQSFSVEILWVVQN